MLLIKLPHRHTLGFFPLSTLLADHLLLSLSAEILSDEVRAEAEVVQFDVVEVVVEVICVVPDQPGGRV